MKLHDLKGRNLTGRKVQFDIMKKDSKGNLKQIPAEGKILHLNYWETGFVIAGISVPGLYNRDISDIVPIEVMP